MKKKMNAEIMTMTILFIRINHILHGAALLSMSLTAAKFHLEYSEN